MQEEDLRSQAGMLIAICITFVSQSENAEKNIPALRVVLSRQDFSKLFDEMLACSNTEIDNYLRHRRHWPSERPSYFLSYWYLAHQSLNDVVIDYDN